MRTERTRMALSAAALAALVTLAGCTASTSPSAESSKKPDAVPSTATGSLEELARRAECTPDVQTDARELRQANCSTPYGKYVLTTFATDRGQREWINGAKDYGGSYLVGRKWAAVGEPDVITALRGRLGGDVEAGEGHSGHHGS